MKLTELDHLPDGLLERPASALYQQLDGPTLIHLVGRNKRPLFVSVLQHGNEVTGWEAVRRLLKAREPNGELPRSLLLFIGNIQGAKHRLRRLDDQPDYNRCWPGGDNVDPEHVDLFRRIHARIVETRPIAGMDIHNNTGLNPHYAAVNVIRSEHLRLASLFAPQIVYFTMPKGTLSHSLAEFFPMVTLECGQAGEIHGTDHTLAYLETCLHLEKLPQTRVDADVVHLYHMVATVTVRHDVLFGFGQIPADLALRENLDHFNFCELPPGSVFGAINNNCQQPLIVKDTSGTDVSEQYFAIRNNHIETIKEVVPSMLTLDRRVIQQDCLCYLMERIHYEDQEEITSRDPLPESLRRSDRPGEPAHKT